MRILDWHFPAPSRHLIDLNHPGGATLSWNDASGPVEVTAEAAVSVLPVEFVNLGSSKANAATLQRNSANLCPKCGQMTYIQDGKCRQCRNPACGYKDGGCGE